MAKQTPDKCPVCGGELIIKEMECTSCHTKISGTLPLIGHELTEKEWNIVKMFVLCDGSFKCMSEYLNMSYPTIKKLMDNIKEKIGGEININTEKIEKSDTEFSQILNKIEKGEISVKKGLKLIKRRKK